MSNRDTRRRGFTLLEEGLVLGIFTVMIAGTAGVYLTQPRDAVKKNVEKAVPAGVKYWANTAWVTNGAVWHKTMPLDTSTMIRINSRYIMKIYNENSGISYRVVYKPGKIMKAGEEENEYEKK